MVQSSSRRSFHRTQNRASCADKKMFSCQTTSCRPPSNNRQATPSSQMKYLAYYLRTCSKWRILTALPHPCDRWPATKSRKWAASNMVARRLNRPCPLSSRLLSSPRLLLVIPEYFDKLAEFPRDTLIGQFPPNVPGGILDDVFALHQGTSIC